MNGGFSAESIVRLDCRAPDRCEKIILWFARMLVRGRWNAEKKNDSRVNWISTRHKYSTAVE